MRRVSPARAGFTLIEMSVVITILALMAALTVPNLVAIKTSRDGRDKEEAIRRLPSQALSLAREGKTAVTLKVDGSDLVLEQVAKDDPDTTDEVKRLSLGSFSVSSTRKAGESSDTSSWEWKVYPDGTAEAATLEINEGTGSKTLQLTPEGDARWLGSGETEQTSEKWTAGELEQRTQ
jgi:prepilin-type N-terminal cleavage/methylation domain-containing protein